MKVAGVNSNDEILESLCELFQAEGLQTAAAHLLAFKRHERDFASFLAEEQPEAVGIDLPPPYEDNVRFFEAELRPLLEGRRVVLTSTNERVVRPLLDRHLPVYEILGKPFDLNRIVAAVRERPPPPTP